MSEWGTCEGCSTDLVLCGPPINDIYCPNEECDWDRLQMIKLMAETTARQERADYERLKAKYG